MNKTTSNVSRGQSVGRVQDRLSKRYEFEAKYLCDNDQTEPVRILFGRDCLTTTQLVPIFNLKEVKKKSSVGKGGKGGSSTQTEYYGGLAFSVCVGEVDKLYRIYNGDGLIYCVYSDENDGNDNGEPLTPDTGKTYRTIEIPADGSEYGTLRFYRGTEVQEMDPAFSQKITLVPSKDTQNEEINIIPAGCTPAFKGICYFASDYFRYGTSNSVPNLRVEVECQPKIFFEDVDATSGLTLEAFFEPNTDTEGTTHTSHSVVMPVLDKNGDTYIPLVIYEILRNKTWGGAGLSKDDIDIQSFIDALHICFNEHNVVSPCIDSSTSIRDAISQCLEYVDGVLVLENDLITLKLIRRKDTPIDIGTAALVEEPRITWSGADDTWGVTKVSFNERINSYESTSEVFESPLYNPAANFGVYKTEDYDLPWIKTRYVAAMLARRLGHVGAVPDCEATLTVLPSAAENITCGSLISLTYEKLNIKNLILRVNEITLGKPEKPSIELKCVRQVLTDWEIDSDVFSKYLSRFTRQEFLNTPGGWYKPRVLPVYKGGVAYDKEQTPDGFFCFVAKNPDCPTTNLLYKCVCNNAKKIQGVYNFDGKEVRSKDFLKSEIDDNHEGGYSAFGRINSITISEDKYEIDFVVDKCNKDWIDELRNEGRALYLATCALKKENGNWKRFWKPVFWRVEEIGDEPQLVDGTNYHVQLTCDLQPAQKDKDVRNYFSVLLESGKIHPAQNAYLFLEESVYYKDYSLRYRDTLKYPFVDIIYTIAYFSQTKEYEDETKAGYFVLYRNPNDTEPFHAMVNKYNPVLDPDSENYDESLDYGSPLLIDNMVNHLQDNFDNAWGDPVADFNGTVSVVSDPPVISASDEDTGDTLIYCTGNGNIYNSIGEVIGTFDNSAYITELDHAVSYPDDNDTLTVIRGKDNIIILNITGEDQSYSLSADMMEGDYLRIITMTDSEIPSDTTCTVYPPDGGNFTMTNGETANSVLLACGTTLELFCILQDGIKTWLAVLSANTRIKNDL